MTKQLLSFLLLVAATAGMILQAFFTQNEFIVL